MKKILLIVPSFGIGGMECQVAELINMLSGQYRFYLISISNAISCFARIKNKASVKCVVLNKKKSNFQFSWLPLIVALKEINPDVVTTFNWGSIEGILSARLCGIRKVIHCEHGFSVEDAQKRKWRRIWGRKLLLKLATNVVVVSSGLKELAKREWGVGPHKIKQINNGVDTQKFSPAFNVVRKNIFGFSENAFIVGTVASLTPVKNQRLLVDILWSCHKEFPRLRVVMVGEGPEEAHLIKYAQEKDVFDKIILYGATSDTSALYRAFDVFLLSSLSEQMPISILEAMASGLPVLATDVGDIKEMVSLPNRQYVYPLEQREEMVGGLKELINNKDLISSIGKANRLKAETNYSIDRSIAAYQALFES